MNAPHLHLILNHFPIVIPFVGLGILVISFFNASGSLRKTAYGIFVAGSLAAIAGFLTGEGAEEAIEGLAGISSGSVEEHEEAAKLFMILTCLLGGLSVVAFLVEWKLKKLAVPAAVTICLVTIGVLITAQQAGTSGGRIRHPEISTAGAARIPASGVESDDD